MKLNLRKLNGGKYHPKKKDFYKKDVIFLLKRQPFQIVRLFNVKFSEKNTQCLIKSFLFIFIVGTANQPKT